MSLALISSSFCGRAVAFSVQWFVATDCEARKETVIRKAKERAGLFLGKAASIFNGVLSDVQGGVL